MKAEKSDAEKSASFSHFTRTYPGGTWSWLAVPWLWRTSAQPVRQSHARVTIYSLLHSHHDGRTFP